jgi:predicted RNase H-like HicB family nuclease
LTEPVSERSLPIQRIAMAGKRKSRIHSYVVVFEPVAEGGYNVVVPAIPEICTFGRTLADAKRMGADAIRCHLESLEKQSARFPRDLKRPPRIARLGVHISTK